MTLFTKEQPEEVQIFGVTAQIPGEQTISRLQEPEQTTTPIQIQEDEQFQKTLHGQGQVQQSTGELDTHKSLRRCVPADPLPVPTGEATMQFLKGQAQGAARLTEPAQVLRLIQTERYNKNQRQLEITARQGLLLPDRTTGSQRGRHLLIHINQLQDQMFLPNLQLPEVHTGNQMFLPKVHPDSPMFLPEVIVQVTEAHPLRVKAVAAAAEGQKPRVAEAVIPGHHPAENQVAGNQKRYKKADPSLNRLFSFPSLSNVNFTIKIARVGKL